MRLLSWKTAEQIESAGLSARTVFSPCLCRPDVLCFRKDVLTRRTDREAGG